MTNLLSAKNVSLIALVFQQVGLVIIIRHSRMRKMEDDSVPYLTSTAVVSAECLKLILNLSLELLLVKREGSSSIGTELANPESLKLAIPALLYVVQNNLLFVALSNLSVPLYQVTNQGKLLTTAMCSRLLLNKSISGMQYVSLVVLALGVAVVQLSSIEKVEASDKNVEHGQLIGLVAVIASCFTSGFAGVYFEKMLKSTQKVSVYMRNMQLAMWSILLGLIPVFLHDFDSIQQNGFFQGYDKVVVGVIVCQTMTGLVVALVMKYADTILKGFATSVAVVLATVVSIFIWNARVDGWFVVGAAMVMTAVALYSKYPPTTKDKHDTSLKCEWSRMWLLPVILMLFVVVNIGLSSAAISITKEPTQEYMEFTDHPVEKFANISITNEPPQECMKRDLSNYTKKTVRPAPVTGKVKAALYDDHCLRFECNRNISKCDNPLATNFDGPDPPCCVHILRDIAREFDRVMCYLGLEYIPAFGMLLGLARSDRLIPWTDDNDYTVSTATMEAMLSLWDSASHLEHGLYLVYEGIDRMCVTPSFANGKLLRWKANGTKLYILDGIPYADFYIGDFNSDDMFVDTMKCAHHVSSLRPYERRAFYNGTLHQYFPSKPQNILTEVYGSDWKNPDPARKPHGNTNCGVEAKRQVQARQRQVQARLRQV
jgi:UDP-sugar transporter A1/2/3